MAKPKFASRKDAGQGFELQLVDDTGAKIDWFVKVVGADSDAYQAALRDIQRRNIDVINRTRKVAFEPEQQEESALELAVSATIGWRGEDAIAPFSAAEARRIYAEYPQIREQVDRAVNDRANFLPDAAKA